MGEAGKKQLQELMMGVERDLHGFLHFPGA